jgi:hypothetical protein
VFLRRAAFAAAGAAAGAAAFKGCRLDPRDLRVVRVRVPCPGLARGEIRALVFSDVDWPRSRAVWERIPAIAAAFAPHLLLLPGDILDRAATVTDPGAAAAAGRWLAGIAPRTPVLVAPGEAESPRRDRLAAAWGSDVAILANESRRLASGDASVEIFVADPKTDPAPWGLRIERGRPLARVLARREGSPLAWAGLPAVERGLEASFAFRLDAAGTQFEARLFDAWRLRSRPGRRSLFLQRKPDPQVALRGSTVSSFTPPLAVWCRGRVRLERSPEGVRVRARFWEEALGEPNLWAIDAEGVDPETPARAAFAFVARRGIARVAEVRVASLDGAPVLDERFDHAGVFRSRWTEASRLAAWARSSPRAPTRVVLSHHPDVVLTLAEGDLPRPDLVISGHTHGGQIRLPFLGPVLTDTRLGRRYDRGIFDVEGTRLFVSAGVGTSILPIRWDVPPDVGLVTLVPGRRDEPATLLDSAAPEANP